MIGKKVLKKTCAAFMAAAMLCTGAAVLPQVTGSTIAVQAATTADYVKLKETKIYNYSNNYTAVYKTPEIRLTSADAKAANSEITSIINKYKAPWSHGSKGSKKKIDYVSYLNGNILSLVIDIDDENNLYIDYLTYNFNVKTGKRLYNKDIKNALGVSDKEAYDLMYNYVSYANDHRSIGKGDRSKTMTSSNINSCALFTTGKNKLGFIYKIYNYAGPEYHMYPGEVTVNPAPVLNKTTLSLGRGESFKLTANQSVAWRTSDSKLAKVDKNGNVKTVGTGVVYITAKNLNGKEKACKITVKNAPGKITLTKGAVTIGVGEKYTVGSTVNSGAACSKRTYRTSNSSVVKMTRTDWQGDFVGVKPGVAYVTVRTYNGKESSCKVTVKAAPTKVSLSKGTMTLKVGQSASLSASIPSNAGCASRTFRTSNSSVVKMTKTNWTGSFKAVKAGTAYVTVRTYNGKEASCKINVVNPNQFDMSKYTGRFTSYIGIVDIIRRSDGRYDIFSELVFNGGMRISQMSYTADIKSNTITFNTKDSWLNTYKYTITFKDGKVYFSQKLVKYAEHTIWAAPDENNLLFTK